MHIGKNELKYFDIYLLIENIYLNWLKLFH